MALPVKFKWFKQQTSNKMNGLLALSPLFVFIGVYMLSSVLAKSFYAIPVSVSLAFASVYGILITRRYESTSTSSIVSIFSKGVGNENILLMIWIVIFAGAFAGSSKDIGAIDTIVNMVVAYLPGRLLYIGLFLSSCLISMAIGSNIGTLVALLPIVTGLSTETGISTAYMTGIVMGGAMFGDNLSFISDTTIVATSAVGCSLKDKFRVNILIAGPAAIIVIAFYLITGNSVEISALSGEIHWIKLLPYIATILFAMMGMNVITVLVVGTILNGVIGMIMGTYNIVGWMISIGNGIDSISQLIIMIMLAGGMLELVRYNGGIDFLVRVTTKHIHGKRGAEFGLAALVGLATCATANNTIAILTTGRIAKTISEKHNVNPLKAASIMDTFACIVQCMLPYGMHILLATAMTHVGAFAIIKYLYYPMVLLVVSVLSILLRFPRKYS